MSFRILVVDDEPAIVDLVAMVLKYEKYDVVKAVTGQEALKAVNSERPDLIILDVMLPDMDGFAVAEQLQRLRSKTPIIFLTAKDDISDKVRGLTIGGDDYITKPFAVEELLVRVQVALRRQSSLGETPNKLVFADLELYQDSHEVYRNGSLVELTDTEFRLLQYLLENARVVLTHAQILDQVWNYDFSGDTSILETYISYLRKKVDTTEPHLIHTVRGVGYVLRIARE